MAVLAEEVIILLGYKLRPIVSYCDLRKAPFGEHELLSMVTVAVLLYLQLQFHVMYHMT